MGAPPSLPDRPILAPASSHGESWAQLHARERIAPSPDDRAYICQLPHRNSAKRLESGALDHNQRASSKT